MTHMQTLHNSTVLPDVFTKTTAFTRKIVLEWRSIARLDAPDKILKLECDMVGTLTQ